MPITIADITLDRVQNIRIKERQSVVEHRVPGAEGSMYQNLGRLPVRLLVQGILQGSAGIEQLQRLRETLNAGDTVAFSSDTVTPETMDKVVITHLQVAEIAGRPLYFNYTIELKEVVEPPGGLPDTDALAEIDTEVLEEAGGFLENLEDGLAALQGAEAVKAVVDRLSPKIKRLGELVQKLNGRS
jgi:molybdopterin converting factor small subunit